MGLLSRKPKINIEEFFRQFYDLMVFNPTIRGEDFNEIWGDTVFKSVVEADQSFTKIDKRLFQEEVTAIRLELIALAWIHKFPREEFTIPQSIFTKRYLKEKRKLKLWGIMEEYNQEIAQSSRYQLQTFDLDL